MESIPGYDRWKTTEPEEQPEAVLHCDMCGEPIYEGDTYYDIAGDRICANCMDGYSRIA